MVWFLGYWFEMQVQFFIAVLSAPRQVIKLHNPESVFLPKFHQTSSEKQGGVRQSLPGHRAPCEVARSFPHV